MFSSDISSIFARSACALMAGFTVSAPAEAANEVDVFRDLVKRYFPKRAVRQVDKEAFLRLEIAKEGVPESEEGYTFEVGADAVTVRARTTHGLFHGVNTLGNLFRNPRRTGGSQTSSGGTAPSLELV